MDMHLPRELTGEHPVGFHASGERLQGQMQRFRTTGLRELSDKAIDTKVSRPGELMARNVLH